jgi:urease accessory protein
VKGHLHLELAPAQSGQTRISRQSFQAPMHLGKPHWDGRTLVLQTVNCTAGVFGGDELDLSIHARSNACAVVTSPSAQRVHPPRDNTTPALATQRFEVEPDAWLDVSPEIFIPHRGARFIQRTRIQLHNGADFFYIESMAPGRVGYGESHQFARLDWTTDLVYDDRLIFRERFVLEKGSESLGILLRHSPTAYHANAIVCSPRLPSCAGLREQVVALETAGCRMAASFLEGTVATIRFLATDSPSLRLGIASLRSLIYSVLNRPPPEWRKL